VVLEGIHGLSAHYAARLSEAVRNPVRPGTALAACRTFWVADDPVALQGTGREAKAATLLEFFASQKVISAENRRRRFSI